MSPAADITEQAKVNLTFLRILKEKANYKNKFKLKTEVIASDMPL
jgi:hypothetical protein